MATSFQRRLALAAALSLSLPCVTRGQAVLVTAGPTVPTDAMAERRRVGGQFALAMGPVLRRGGLTWRAEIARGWFAAQPWGGTLAGTPREGTLAISSALAYALFASAPGPLGLHAGIGTGVYRQSIPRRRNPYGLSPGVGLVAGMTFGRGRVRGLAELQWQGILSDFGVGDFAAPTFVPVRVGVVVQQGSSTRGSR